MGKAAAYTSQPVAPARAVRMPRGETIRLVLFFVVVAACYLWIVDTSLPGLVFDRTDSGPYGWLGDALAHGQLNLRYPEIPDQLRALPDPYDPNATASFRFELHLHDLSYYNDKLYVFWGVVPAILLFAPLNLLGIWMSQGLAVVILCFGGLVFSVLILRFLVRRFLPDTPSWALWVGQVTLACANAVPFALRRAEHSEISIGGGMCFGFLAIWLFLLGWLRPTPSLGKIAGASLALGLAVGSRPTWVLATLVPVVLAISEWRRGRPNRARTCAALLGPLALCGLLVMAYNAARFGSPVEFGSKYQLAAFPQTDYAAFTPAYLGPGLFYYVLGAPHLTPLFPFVILGPPPSYPWRLPDGYLTSFEPTGGLLPLVPIVLALVLLPVVGRRWERDLRRVAFVLAGIGVGVVLMISGALWSTTARYQVDFTTFLLIPALLVWFTAFTSPHRVRRRVAVVAGSAALTWSVLLGILLSFTGYGLPLPATQPKLLARLESTFSPISRLVAGAAGRPVVGRYAPAPTTLQPLVSRWSALGRDPVTFQQGATPTTLRVASAHTGSYELRGLAQLAGDPAAPVTVDLSASTRHGDASVTIRSAVLTSFAIPVEIDAGVVSIKLSARAARGAAIPPMTVRVVELARSPGR